MLGVAQGEAKMAINLGVFPHLSNNTNTNINNGNDTNNISNTDTIKWVGETLKRL